MNVVLTIIALSIGVISIIIAIVLYFKRRKARTPIWYYKTTGIIDGVESISGDISVHFKEQPVPRVSVTKLGFVNLGGDTISNMDVRKPIIVKFSDDVSILKDPEVVRHSRSEIEFSATREGNSIKLSFDFLDRLDGAVIEITHTGDENAVPELVGTIRGVRKGITQRSHKYALKRKTGSWLYQSILLGVYTVLLLWALINGTISDMAQGRIDIWFTVIFTLLAALTLFGFVKILMNWKKSLPSWLRIED